jgi:hypothetical protein
VSPEFGQASLSATVRITSGAYGYVQATGQGRGGEVQGIFTAGVRVQF